MRPSRAVVAGVALLVVAAVTSSVLLVRTGQSDRDDAAATLSSTSADGWTRVGQQAPARWRPAAASLPHEAGSPGPMRVADGVPPPTNRWYSGMFFGSTPQPVFAVPLAVQAQPDAVSVGLPQVTATGKTIAGAFAPQLRVGLPTDDFTATRADPVSVTSTFTSAGRSTGRLDMAEGWPYVSYTALRPQSVTVPAGLVRHDAGQWLGTTVGGSTYGLAVARRDGTRRPLPAASGKVRLSPHESLLVFAAPDTGTAATLAHGAVPITGTSTRYKVADGQARTALTYRTPHRRPTVVAAMPHHTLDGSGEVVGEVPSVYGPLRLVRTRTLTTHVASIPPVGTLDLSRLTDADRAELRGQVGSDVAAALAAPAPPADTYFGGKSVYRLAQLYRLAQAAGADDAADRVRARVVHDLDAWLDGSSTCPAQQTHCFYYDTAFRGVVGRTASFGSDQFNDHHFHYGYFFAAAALVGEGHPELLDRWRSTLRTLAEDVASPVTNRDLPALRPFDPYAGHSWASGTSPFGDGNNQESSSEAVNAWNGLALWAQADGQDGLARQATWQLSLESAAAQAYWLQPKQLPAGYDHPFVSLNWGGKREWATWFSAKPSAVLGIQLIPMPPVLDEVGAAPERVRANLADATPDGYDTMFGDYLTMYLALADPQRALSVARGLPDSAIDEGDSRSYLLAWVLAHARAAW